MDEGRVQGIRPSYSEDNVYFNILNFMKTSVSVLPAPLASKLRLAFCTFMVFLTTGNVASGQNLGQQVLEKSSTQLTQLLTSVTKLLQIILGLGALVTLVMVIFNIFKGEREAATKIAWWVAGLTLGFVLITVVAGLVQGATGTTGA